MFGLGATSNAQLVMFVCLVLRRFVAEEPPNCFAEGELRSGAAGFAVGESVTTKIVDLRAEFA